jgi:D-alanyl-D-alanine carboxypeptidase/D-alanyl-D-alanine-endopeptidase (penicillin-binding protein 4)
MKKIIVLFVSFLLITGGVFAKTAKVDFDSVIKNSDVDRNSISISIKDINSGKTVYSLNDKILRNPASVQKLIMTPIALDEIGANYTFSTQLYDRGNNTYLIKLGADPYLTSTDLKQLVSKIEPTVSKIYIDDSILDTKTWGEGWQWDDDLNISMPKFSSYNLDKNLIKITVIPPEKDGLATIINPSKYPLVFFNNITKGNSTNIKVSRDNEVSANTIVLNGTVARATTIYIPTNNLRRYFELQLTKSLEDRKIYLKDSFGYDKKKNSDILKSEISHELNLDDILKQSNNMIAETIFKIAGAKHSSLQTGTDSAGIKMINDYCVKHNLDNSRIKIADGSGVSKNNLLTADFVTEFLLLNKDNSGLKHLPTSGEGTLTLRMAPLKNNLRAKTGTLSDVSSIAGYITTKNNKNYAFCILTNDTQLSTSDKKMLEDFILRELYLGF